MHGTRTISVLLAYDRASLHMSATPMTLMSHNMFHMLGKQLPIVYYCSYIQEAYNPHITHLQASSPVSFNTSFFIPTGGHSVSNARDPSPIRQFQDDHHSSDNDEAENSQNGSHSIRETI
jgi:hypothetical protein